jgi:hypothetical protein
LIVRPLQVGKSPAILHHATALVAAQHPAGSLCPFSVLYVEQQLFALAQHHQPAAVKHLEVCKSPVDRRCRRCCWLQASDKARWQQL